MSYVIRSFVCAGLMFTVMGCHHKEPATTEKLPDGYRTHLRFELPSKWTALMPSEGEAFVKVVPKDGTKGVVMKIFRPIGDPAPHLGMTHTREFVAQILEQELKGRAVVREYRTSGHIFLTKAGLQGYERSVETNEGAHLTCRGVEAMQEVQVFCIQTAASDLLAVASPAMAELFLSIQAGQGVPVERPFHYGTSLAFFAPQSWTTKIIDKGSGLQLSPDKETDPTLKPGEHTATATVYLPTEWNGSARDYFDAFTTMHAPDYEAQIQFESRNQLLVKMTWHKQETPGGHQALCYASIQQGLAQMACFSGESDAAMKEHGEIGRRFIGSIAEEPASYPDKAPCKPSRNVPRPNWIEI